LEIEVERDGEREGGSGRERRIESGRERERGMDGERGGG